MGSEKEGCCYCWLTAGYCCCYGCSVVGRGTCFVLRASRLVLPPRQLFSIIDDLMKENPAHLMLVNVSEIQALVWRRKISCPQGVRAPPIWQCGTGTLGSLGTLATPRILGTLGKLRVLETELSGRLYCTMLNRITIDPASTPVLEDAADTCHDR